jgi:sensor c-di-GMP phosphodiesterase-like protein
MFVTKCFRKDKTTGQVIQPTELTDEGLVVLHSIKLAKDCKVQILAEGIDVNDALVYEFLRELGVELFQGWFFSMALPLEALIKDDWKKKALQAISKQN